MNLTLNFGSFVLCTGFVGAVAWWRTRWLNKWDVRTYFLADLTRGGKHACVELEPDVALVRSFEKILNLYPSGQALKMLVLAGVVLHPLLGAQTDFRSKEASL